MKLLEELDLIVSVVCLQVVGGASVFSSHLSIKGLMASEKMYDYLSDVHSSIKVLEVCWLSHKIQRPLMYPWRYSSMGGELLGDLLPSGKLNVCQGHDYSENPKRSPHQFNGFCYGLHPGWYEIINIHGTPNRFWGWRVPPQIMGHYNIQKPLLHKGFRPGMVWETQGRYWGYMVFTIKSEPISMV